MEIYLIQIYVMLLAEKVFHDMELVKLPIKQHPSLLHKKQGNIQGNYVLTHRGTWHYNLATRLIGLIFLYWYI